MYSGIGDENDIDSGRVYLGMKLTTGMNQEVIFSDLIKDKKIYNFGIKKIEAVTEIFGEDDSPQKIQVVLNGGTLKKKDMTASLEYINEPLSTGTILSDRIVEFPTTLPPSSLNDLQPIHFKITISSKETSSRKWSIKLDTLEDCRLLPKKRNIASASVPEPECSWKSPRLDVQTCTNSDLNDIVNEYFRINPSIPELNVDSPLMNFGDSNENAELKEKYDKLKERYDALAIDSNENVELKEKYDELKERYDALAIEMSEVLRENQELRLKLNEMYHSVTASDFAKKCTNNLESVDDQIDIIIAEDFKNMRLEQKAFWQHIDKSPLLNKIRLTIVQKCLRISY